MSVADVQAYACISINMDVYVYGKLGRPRALTATGIVIGLAMGMFAGIGVGRVGS